MAGTTYRSIWGLAWSGLVWPGLATDGPQRRRRRAALHSCAGPAHRAPGTASSATAHPQPGTSEPGTARTRRRPCWCRGACRWPLEALHVRPPRVPARGLRRFRRGGGLRGVRLHPRPAIDCHRVMLHHGKGNVQRRVAGLYPHTYVDLPPLELLSRLPATPINTSSSP